MRKLLLYKLVLLCMLFTSCNDDNDINLIDFTVSFSEETQSLTAEDTSQEILITYSRAATENGSISVNYTLDNATYGDDFTTTPVATSGVITIPVAIGDLSATLAFNKLTNPIEGTTKSVTFSITSFDQTSWVQGTTNSTLMSFTPVASSGGVIDVESGGSTLPHSVYIDLSTGVQTTVNRDSWEIAVYNGTENVVFLNASLLVSAAELKGITDINAVNENTALSTPVELNSLDLSTFSPITVTVSTVSELIEGLPLGYSQYGNNEEGLVFTDDKSGALDNTAFATISTNENENNVYIVGLGNAVPTEAAESGSINSTGEHKGFMKVRILSDDTSYTIQYAALDATTFSEVTITKNSDYILTAFNLNTGAIIVTEPTASNWDLNFSGVFSYYGFQGIWAGLTYSDYVLHNTLGNAAVYEVLTYTTTDDVVTNLDVPSYTDFTLSDVDETAFIFDDRSTIGSSWRSVNIYTGDTTVKDDRYFVLKDAADNYYKIKFTALLSSEGERGNPQLVYEKL